MLQSDNNQRVKRFYVYGHYTFEGNIFYIGVGTILNLQTTKLLSRYARAYHFSHRTKFWNHIKNKNGVIVKILSEFYTREEALLEEKRLISFWGKRLRGGVLCNLSDGGEQGPIGHKKPMSEQQKKKLSDIKSSTLYVYDSNGIFIKSLKTIKSTAKFCGVTYNAICSCLNTKNFSNGYFVFKEYKGVLLGYGQKDLIFKSSLSKKVVTENELSGIKIVHQSVADCAAYLKTDRKNLKNAIFSNRICKKHKVYFEGTISSQASKS